MSATPAIAIFMNDALAVGGFSGKRFDFIVIECVLGLGCIPLEPVQKPNTGPHTHTATQW
jgi:hypothetical protein